MIDNVERQTVRVESQFGDIRSSELRWAGSRPTGARPTGSRPGGNSRPAGTHRLNQITVVQP
jgi:hypothetical protein